MMGIVGDPSVNRFGLRIGESEWQIPEVLRYRVDTWSLIVVPYLLYIKGSEVCVL